MKRVQKIPLSEIDLTDETFSINFMPDLAKLRSSIEEIGLIQPVLLRKKHHEYQVVCGFRRIAVLKEAGLSDVLSIVVDEKEGNDLQLFLISLHENLMTRGFNTIEKAIALDKLVRRFEVDPPQVIEKYLPLLDLEPDEKILKTYLCLVPMEDEVKRYILNEQVSRTNIRKISCLSPQERTALLSLISPLKLGENRLREILTFLEEIASREGESIQQIVRRPEIQAVLSHRALTPSQRAERIKRVLLALRYPRLEEQERRFEEKRKRLGLPPNVLVQHSPFFEGKGLKIEFRFESIAEYRSLLSSLSNLADREEFKEMIES